MRKHSVVFFGGLFSLMSLFPILGPFKAEGASKERELKWVSFRPETHQGVIGIRKNFIDPINNAAKGQLKIVWKGGPDTMAPMDVGLAVQRGTIDIGSIYVGAYEAVVPGIGATMLTQLTPEEERRPGGVYDYVQSLHQKAGLYFIGRPDAMHNGYFYTWLRNKKLQKKEDFKGTQIGSATAARGAVIAWGSTNVTVAIPENYSALEKGMVQGIAGQPLAGAVGFGWYEKCKYVIDHPYYQSTVVMIMNRKTWDSLSPSLQQLITKHVIAGEKSAMEEQEKVVKGLREKVVGAGVEFYKLAPDVEDWYIKTAYEAAWEYQQKRFPEVTPKLKELMSK